MQSNTGNRDRVVLCGGTRRLPEYISTVRENTRVIDEAFNAFLDYCIVQTHSTCIPILARTNICKDVSECCKNCTENEH